MTRDPLVLDLDRSVGALAGERRLELSSWQETMRFSSTLAQVRRFRAEVDSRAPSATGHGTVLTGSGDFHHLSWPLIERVLARRTPHQPPIRMLVFDNHPDNMRFPFGVHCGSWVRRVAALSAVAEVIVAGITSSDIGWGHCWENQLRPLVSGKLSYWSIGVDTSWSRWLGLSSRFRNFGDAGELTDTLCNALRDDPRPTYLTIDKDALSPEVVKTNWDQGQLLESHLGQAIDALRGRIVGSDITGDVSAYRYQSAFKRWLSQADAQDTDIEPVQLRVWQADQHALNRRLVARIAEAAG